MKEEQHHWAELRAKNNQTHQQMQTSHFKLNVSIMTLKEQVAIVVREI